MYVTTYFMKTAKNLWVKVFKHHKIYVVFIYIFAKYCASIPFALGCLDETILENKQNQIYLQNLYIMLNLPFIEMFCSFLCEGCLMHTGIKWVDPSCM